MLQTRLLVVRSLIGRDQQEFFDVRRHIACGDEPRIGGHRDAEAAQVSTEMTLEMQLDFEFFRVNERLGEVEHGRMPTPLATVDGPPGLQVIVDRVRGSEPRGCVTMTGMTQGELVGPHSQPKIAEIKIARRAFVIGAAGTVAGQAVIGQGLELNRGDGTGRGAKLEPIGIGLGLIGRSWQQSEIRAGQCRPLRLASYSGESR